MTFNELTKWYLNLEKVKALARYPIMTINLNSFNAEFGNVVVNQLKPVELENYQAKNKAVGYADAYIDQQISVAKTMVNKAFDNDLISGDILRVFKKVKKLLKRNGNARKTVIASDKFEEVMKKAPQHTRSILATAFYTGMRRGEILNLTWDKVDLKNRVIRLESTDTKDREPRRVPICNVLYEILRNIPRAIHDSHVFLYRGKPIRDLRAALKRALKDAGLQYGRSSKDGLVFHDLRHTFNTNMRKAGIPESVIMEITGHSTREMFLRYDTVDETDTRNAVDRFEGYLKNVDQNVDQHPSKTQRVDPSLSQPPDSFHGAEAGT
jgi:integrase